jgi:CHAD domain-containing protein
VASQPGPAANPGSKEGAGVEEKSPGARGADGEARREPEEQASAFRRRAERRLRRWHRRIAADWKDFDKLDEAGLHSLRKRIKRQRYAVEFFAPVLRERTMKRYLKPLALIQDRMGELNDLFVARARYQSLVEADPAAWFALGWLAARIAEVRALAKPELKSFATSSPPLH